MSDRPTIEDVLDDEDEIETMKLFNPKKLFDTYDGPEREEEEE